MKNIHFKIVWLLWPVDLSEDAVCRTYVAVPRLNDGEFAIITGAPICPPSTDRLSRIQSGKERVAVDWIRINNGQYL